jgi:hypothetical protein
MTYSKTRRLAQKYLYGVPVLEIGMFAMLLIGIHFAG